MNTDKCIDDTPVSCCGPLEDFFVSILFSLKYLNWVICATHTKEQLERRSPLELPDLQKKDKLTLTKAEWIHNEHHSEDFQV